MLVPLVLLQALQSEGQSLTTLLNVGLRFLEEDEAHYIIQQGGWVSFNQENYILGKVNKVIALHSE